MIFGFQLSPPVVPNQLYSVVLVAFLEGIHSQTNKISGMLLRGALLVFKESLMPWIT